MFLGDVSITGKTERAQSVLSANVNSVYPLPAASALSQSSIPQPSEASYLATVSSKNGATKLTMKLTSPNSQLISSRSPMQLYTIDNDISARQYETS
jgi:hypothetical protein